MSAPTQAARIGAWLAIEEPAVAARVKRALDAALAYAHRLDAPDREALQQLRDTIVAELAAEEA
mgnify:FL=1